MKELLEPVCALVREAGAMLLAETERPDGPRGEEGTAPVDTEIEWFLRPRLLALRHAGWRGEETGTAPADSPYCWVVDPHDGTRDFLGGARGTAVSVALLHCGVPVLGVVYAPMPPDCGPDLLATAAGGPVLRNGVACPPLPAAGLDAGAIVLLSRSTELEYDIVGPLLAPARYVALSSIAYRLARVAAGDAVAAASLHRVESHDVAAGHALLLAAGGTVTAGDGAEIAYAADGSASLDGCVGGSATACRALASRLRRLDQPMHPPAGRAWRGTTPALDRAIGCLFGQVIGDSLGSLVEFRSAAAIARAYPDGVRDLADGGPWNTLAGQPTDDSELALALARACVDVGAWREDSVIAAYAGWYRSSPFDIGGTTARALAAAAGSSNRAAAARAAASRDSQANGSLMRIAPIGLIAVSAAQAAALAREDSSLTHPHPVCQAACAAQAAAIWTAIHTGDRDAAIAAALATASAGAGPVADTLRAALAGERLPAEAQIGWVLIALGNAFFHLGRGTPVEAALIETVGRGGDTDTNGAITGALLGAVQGRDAFPRRWVMPMLACRPDEGAPNPRPWRYWPTRLPELADDLLAISWRTAEQNQT